ncbi:MAG TPA: DUF4919 domain-containing protein [Rhizomicrobium sp.]|jgi:hypothetical protein
MRAIGIAVLACLVITGSALAAGTPTLPNDGDEYSKLVARADAQDASLDFRALRLAYLKSAARKRAEPIETQLSNAIVAAVKANDYAGVRDAAVQLLSVDYIDMYGQKFLRQSCKLLKDDACAAKGHFVEFGLLNSIVNSGDGKTCATGWEAFTVKEEYFALAMAGAHLTSQSLAGGCDVMQTVDDSGQPHAYYFRIDVMLQDEAGMLR